MQAAADRLTRTLAIGLALVVFAIGAWAWRRSHPAVHYLLAEWPPGALSPRFDLVDFDGHPRSLASFRGKTVVLFFGFLRCPDACPTELFKLALVMKRLGDERKGLQVLFVTLDPERDAPDLLRGYVRAFDPSFVGLTGTRAQIAAAAATFSVAYQKIERGSDYTIDHSTATYVIDATGHLRLLGAMDTPVSDYVHDLAALAGE